MKRTIALLFLVAARWPSAAPAQPPPDPRPTVITLRPAAEPVPALKYRLVPEQIKLVPGNAAIFYHRGDPHRGRALLRRSGPGRKSSPALSPSRSTCWISRTWLNCPIGEIPRDKARKFLEPFQNALKEAELGALRSTCDWEFDHRRARGRTCSSRRSRRCGHSARLIAAQGAAGDPRWQDRRGHALDRDRPRDGPARQPGPAL